MRIGTWNLAGRWNDGHRSLMLPAECDVWLLTEVNERVELDGFHAHLGEARMAAQRRWAGVFSRRAFESLPDPHPASASVSLDGMTFCSTVLPWRSCGSRPPWVGERHEDKTRSALEELLDSLPSEALVWGGDWNHALSGPELAGSASGRRHIVAALGRLNLQVPTAALSHQIEGLLSIDHIAVGASQTVLSAESLPAAGLSDHDAYVVELAE